MADHSANLSNINRPISRDRKILQGLQRLIIGCHVLALHQQSDRADQSTTMAESVQT